MPTDNNIKNYSAADIEKYWNGKLSASEMHAIEKAAMDDPFLADALEGYKNAGSAQTELDSLVVKLDARVKSPAPVIYLKRTRSTWLRVAAAVIIICGMGLLAEQIVFKKRESPLAESKNIDNAKSEIAIDNKQIEQDSINSNVGSTPDDTSKLKTDHNVPEKPEKGIVSSYARTDTLKSDDRLVGDLKSKEEKKDVVSSISPAIINEGKKEATLDKDADKEKKNTDSAYLSFKNPSPQAKANQAFAESNKKQAVLLSNGFNYRVVDAQNNPVPFANVMNTRDNVGTYTDIRGMFNLLSSDSVLNVQVKSLGYNSSNYKLVPSKLPGDIVLTEDNNARQQVLANNRKVISSIPRKDSAELEEPEVGWGYYNTYVANNIKIPNNIRNKNSSSEVELSFDIDKTGQPINIKVTRSSQCKECDEEAIRLLKEGPKWKRKGKKSKGSVTINVDK